MPAGKGDWMNKQTGESMLRCPNCGAEVPLCDTMGADRAGGTSQRCGNPPAELFHEPFSIPKNQPDTLSLEDQAIRLSQNGVHGDDASMRLLLEKMNYRTVRKFCRAIERKAGSSALYSENILLLAIFDKRLQSVLMQGIGLIELQFRAVYARTMATHLGPFSHHNPENFRSKEFYDSFIEDYSRELSFKLERKLIVNPEDFKIYGDIPIWQAAEILGLGTLSKLYRNTISKEVRRGVADSFGVKYEFLASWLRTICEVRNRCAHFEDVCITPYTSMPKKIKGINAPNDGAFYACLVIERLIEGTTRSFANTPADMHYTLFANNLLDVVGKAPQPVSLAAGFPLNWIKQLKASSNLVSGVDVTYYEAKGKRVL